VRAAPKNAPAASPKPAPGLKSTVEWFDDVEQGSEDWFRLRLGLCTASVFGTIMAEGKDGDASKSRQKLLYRMAAEIISNVPAETYSNDHMQRGIEMEPKAIEHYEFTHQCEIERTGFVRRTIHDPLYGDRVVGASPDGLIRAKKKVLQVKTMLPPLIVALVDSGKPFPSEHRAQCQGELWVTGFDSVDLQIFYEGFPVAPVFTLFREDAYMREIDRACEIFQHDLQRTVAGIKKKHHLK